MNETNSVQPGGPALPRARPAPSRPAYEAGKRERVLLLLALGLGVLAADLLLSMSYHWLGLGVPVGVAAWYGVLLWYVGPGRLAVTRSRLFFAALLLLSLTFVLFSNFWFRFWNTGGLLVLLTVHAFQLSGAARRPWYVPSMLWERFRLLLDGLFGRLGALEAVFRGLTGPAARKIIMAGVGVLVTLPLLLLAAMLLGDADLLFGQLTEGVLDFIWTHLDVAAAKILLGVLAAPFLFSLLYALGRPKALERKEKSSSWRLDSVAAVVVLAGLDGLYLFFVGVQSAALFGGPEYLAKMGISYAEYARSGFFQLVFVTVLNLAVLLTLLQLIAREGKSWQAVRLLGTALAALSGVILVSAGWRMTLYVMAYGLSFKRVLTYWGMGMMALFLAAACVKVWKESFGFFKFAAVAALTGWLALNYANVDRITAEYNVNRYRNGTLEQLDLYYLATLSYEALPVLEQLDGDVVMSSRGDMTLGEYLSMRRLEAELDCAGWETWSLPAWEWAAGWDG